MTMSEENVDVLYDMPTPMTRWEENVEVSKDITIFVRHCHWRWYIRRWLVCTM